MCDGVVERTFENTAPPTQASSGNNGSVVCYFYQDTTSLSLGHTATYIYDALGQRVEKKVGSAYTEILYDGYGDVTAFHDRTFWSQVFIPSVGGRQIMKYQTSLTLFLHGNTLGSTQTITEPGRGGHSGRLVLPLGPALGLRGNAMGRAICQPGPARLGSNPRPDALPDVFERPGPLALP